MCVTPPCSLSQYGSVLYYSDPTLVFVFLLAFCTATVTQCFLISVFFSKANLAAACAGLVYFVLYLPYVLCYAWKDSMRFGAKVAVVSAFTVGFGAFGRHFCPKRITIRTFVRRKRNNIRCRYSEGVHRNKSKALTIAR